MESPANLWAITSYFNPEHYRRRLTNYHIFRQHLQVPLVTVELSFGGAFELQAEDADILVQLRGGDVMWQKERLLNIALQALPSACQKVVWIDCDLIVGSEGWPQRVSRALDVFPLLQPFSRLAYLACDSQVSDDLVPGDIESWRSSAVFMIRTGHPVVDSLTHLESHEQTFSRGMVWAARRGLLSRHGFYDVGVVGNGDLALACAAYGCHDVAMKHQRMNEQQRSHYLDWAMPFYQDVQSAVDYVDGPIFHLWHGTIENRRYLERLKELEPYHFDPYQDIALAENGAWRWNSDKPLLHQYVRNHFASRREDG